ncbi:hypothetical protein PIB30_088857 [Stylosanthes scabra]|uniref:Uncharacterized protein n=1 Tax=Stylosanthes scabra TaxID=79078 RepID=A0ABU6ZT20_9FABA|nr:hypothetical protein [Stylosanthes scabra]
MRGDDVRVEERIADNIAVIAQGIQGKGKLAFPSTIYKLCKDAQVPMHEFRRTELIPLDKPITARLMETTRLGRNVHNISNRKPVFNKTIGSSSSKGSTTSYLEELKMVKARQDELWNNTDKFHHQIRKEQDMIARVIQEVKKFQVNQTLMGFQKEAVEKLEQTIGGQQKEMTKIKKQLKEWTRHAFSRDAYYRTSKQIPT